VRNDPRIAVRSDHWDRDPWKLGVPGGVVDLRTGQLGPEDAGLFITRSTTVVPAVSGTRAPIWERFLWDTFGGDVDLIEFVEMWFGYSLSGDVSAELFAFLHGDGGNGKGTLLNAVTEIAGDYAWHAAMETFMTRKHPGHATSVARLAGARLVYANEVADDASFNLARLKELTGNEGMITANFMHCDEFQFKPVLKLTLVGNHKPRLSTVDAAIKRRLLLIPFLNRPARPDPTLKDRLRQEYPAILRRLIDGCVEFVRVLDQPGWRDQLIPAAVSAATDDYLVEEDVIALWLKERCELDPTGAGMPVGEAHADHQEWATEEGRAPFPSSRKFSAEVVSRTTDPLCRVVHTDKGSVIRGLRLRRS
jgi:putative DNA primase/helicase